MEENLFSLNDNSAGETAKSDDSAISSVNQDTQENNSVNYMTDLDNNVIPDDSANTKKKSFFNFFNKKKSISTDTGLENDGNIDNNIESNPEKTDNIIENNISGDIFQELELGDLNFGEFNEETEKVKKPFNPLVFSINFLNVTFWLLFFGFILSYSDVFVKTTDYDFVSGLPGVCDYIGMSIDGYDNSECKTIPKITADLDKEKTSIEKKIAQDLSIIIPKKIATDYILFSEEVRFILGKNANTRLSLNKIIDDFEKIRQSSGGGYKGENIECSSLVLNEKGEFNVNCTFYGSSVSGFASDEYSKTARGVALDFINKLQSKNSNFTVLDLPNTIEISKFSGTEGIKMIFSTTTQLNLKLKYTLSNKL